MAEDVTRRGFLQTVGGAVATGAVVGTATAQTAPRAGGEKVRIVGIACSPRKGKTT